MDRERRHAQGGHHCELSRFQKHHRIKRVYSPARVMDNFLDYPANVAIAFSIVESAKFSGRLIMVGVGLELYAEMKTNSLQRSEKHTMACDRLCALITRPIAYLWNGVSHLPNGDASDPSTTDPTTKLRMFEQISLCHKYSEGALWTA